MGYDVKGYVELFKGIEEELGIHVFERIGDSRFFANENADNADLFTQFAEHDFHFVPSLGAKEEQGLTALDDWFCYNPNAPIDAANHPRVYIHESCGNLIYAIVNYHTDGKKAEALKDFIDCLRYLRTANEGIGPEHYPPGLMAQKVQGGAY